MSVLHRAKKVDLLTLCDDLGLDILLNPKIADLTKLGTEFEDYDDDFVKDRFEIIIIERNKKLQLEETEKRRRQKEAGLRQEEEEKRFQQEEEERKFRQKEAKKKKRV